MSDFARRIASLSPKRLALLALDLQARVEALESAKREPVAIVGWGCRFPGGASDPELFWELLRDGVDAVTETPGDRWNVDAYYDPNPGTPGKMNTRFGGFLDRPENFDPHFFGIAPREAASMDPQQRLLLEVAWEALENAGCASESLDGSRTGVFVGISAQDYSNLLLDRNPATFDAYLASGGSHAVASGRVSYLFGLQGPNIALDTSCSSSLVAIHLACQSLRTRECDMALAGGVNLILSPKTTIALAQASMMASDGRCKTFDASADGFVRGEGCGVLTLKRLSDALADRDNILALIRGTAINQDGRSNGLTAPNGLAQESVIREALARSGVAPGDVHYVETHGTGTSLGDPIEVEALNAALCTGRPTANALAIGSVKTNLGHLESAAGVAGLIKTVQALRHEEIPPHLHFEKPNPHISWDSIPVRVTTERTPWPRGGKPRIAGVSSFGFSGTNAHVILEEAPVRVDTSNDPDRPVHILALSAKGEDALRELSTRFAGHLQHEASRPFADVCWTENSGRLHFTDRLAVVAESASQAGAALAAFAKGEKAPGLHHGRTAGAGSPDVVFLFTGQGAQRPGMGRQLYDTQPAFRKTMQRCDALLRPIMEQSLLSLLYGNDEAGAALNETSFAQPALFAFEYALAQLWRSWGIEPAAVLGHSVGEYVAACVAGVFGLEDGLRLVAERGRLMQACPKGGAMAAVFAGEDRVRLATDSMAGKVSIAAVNAPKSVVISGERGAVQSALADLKRGGIGAVPLNVSHAFHSPMIEPALSEFESAAAGVTCREPGIPMISNVSGREFPPGEIPGADYWRRQTRRTVRFARGIESLHEQGHRHFLEIGPSPTLLGLARQCRPDDDMVFLPSLRPDRADWATLLGSLATLYVQGARVDWQAFDGDYSRARVALPTYPYQRRPYWIEAPPTDGEKPARGLTSPGAAADPLADWFYEVQWRLKSRGTPAATTDQARANCPDAWLILKDAKGAGAELAGLLRAKGYPCFLVSPGEEFQAVGEGEWHVNPADGEDFRRLIQEAPIREKLSRMGVVDLWPLDTPAGDRIGAAELVQAQQMACGSALSLVQALVASGGDSPPRLWLVTRQSQAVDGASDSLQPVTATLWGLGRSIAIEHPELGCTLVDMGSRDSREVSSLCEEILADDGEEQIAFRRNERWVPRLVRRRMADPRPPGARLGADGVYLVTGGLGGLGLLVARWLVEQGARKVVLTSRRAPSEPARESLRELEGTGARVAVMQADVSDREQAARLFEQIRQTLGSLRGIIHCAGVLDDGVLLQQNWDRFAAVFSPKVSGAWNLHTLTRETALDFFVLFSSGASLFGAAGQGNYAAANAFLDSLAHYRRSRELPALSINWGAWAGVGMAAAEQKRTARIDRTGMGVIEPRQGLQAFERLLGRASGQVGVLPIRWSRTLAQFDGGRPPAFLEEFALEARADSAAAGEDLVAPGLLHRLDHAAPGERRDVIYDLVLHLAVRTLGIDPSHRVNSAQPLSELGLDSLMAVEIRNTLSGTLKQTLPATLLFDHPSVGALADFLAEDASPAPGAGGPGSESAMSETPPPSIPVPLQQLSENEMAALLAKRLSDSDKGE